MSYHNTSYHSEIEESARQSSSIVIDHILNLVQPKSVVDIGCGRGTWLYEWQQKGITDFLGVDGAHQDKKKLLIPENNFIEHDLNQPFNYCRKFDLAVCLEVVEHLHHLSAQNIISTLTGLSDIIVFSAATPNQGGYKHINQQWPVYWLNKFELHGYVFVDALRWKLMPIEQVAWWYRQNIFLVMKKEIYEKSFKTFPLYSPEFYVMHRYVYRISTNFFHRFIFHIQQFAYNNFNSLYNKLLPTVKKIINHK